MIEVHKNLLLEYSTPEDELASKYLDVYGFCLATEEEEKKYNLDIMVLILNTNRKKENYNL